MTVSTVDRACLPRVVVSSRSRLSGVVMRISGGRRSKRWRSPCGVSPLRVAARTFGKHFAPVVEDVA